MSDDVSGAQSLVGFRVSLDREAIEARVNLTIGPEHLNRNGTLHGGFHALLLDTAAGYAASLHFSNRPEAVMPVVTLSLTTSFLASAGEGEITAKAWVTGGGRRIVYAEAHLQQAGGRLLSTASGVFRRAPGA